MAAAAARNPDIGHRGMAIDDEVAVRSVFVLTDLGSEHRCVRQGWKPAAHERAKRALTLVRWQAAAAGRIELRPSGVISDFEPAVEVARNAVHESIGHVDPHRKVRVEESLVAGRSAEV